MTSKVPRKYKQIALVVRDIDKSLKHWHETLGIGPWAIRSFNPKTVRASVGSLWHIPVIPNVKIDEFIDTCLSRNAQIYALSANGSQTLDSEFVTKTVKDPSIWIFGNEARGLPELPQEVKTVSIPMKGFAESLNVASAAAIVLHSVGLSL